MGDASVHEGEFELCVFVCMKEREIGSPQALNEFMDAQKMRKRHASGFVENLKDSFQE